MQVFRFVLVLLLLLVVEILRVYFIMPFPGSQAADTVHIAYWLDQHSWWIRLPLLLLLAFFTAPLWQLLGGRGKFLALLGVLVYEVVFYLFNFRFLADKMFYQPRVTSFLPVAAAGVANNKLVLGIEINGEAKAYPIQYIGYHHQVRDTVGGQPVMVTYCTVCRTGRVYSPLVNGKNEDFRLVGMDHFNAMFEDATTHSWWRQVSGEAITGPLKGQALKELPSQQMQLSAWSRLHPSTLVMQADSNFSKQYEKLASYDRGNVKSSLEKRDSLSWQPKSWVLGMVVDNRAKAYDWNQLVQHRLLQDSFANLPFVITLEDDTASFHALRRIVANYSLSFKATAPNSMTDSPTGSVWTLDGKCIVGALKDSSLQPIPVSQEFWHSWQTFHPATAK